MSESIPASLVEGWISDLQSILKQESQEPKTGTEFLINKGMRHGLDQITSRLDTWLRHQENVQALNRSEEKFLITKDVDLSDGRYRKLEWYQGNLFVVLAWRHGMREEVGELMLELQRVQDLSTTYLVYEGGLTFDDLARMAREGGLDPVKNERNRREWVAKTYTESVIAFNSALIASICFASSATTF